MDEYILKHLQDVLNAIADLEKVFKGYPMRGTFVPLDIGNSAYSTIKKRY